MKIDINLTYLKYFYDAALMGSVSEAARRNFVSQSAVSQAISKLEKSLEASLSLHKKQRFSLTEEGKIVFLKAKEIFSSIRNLQNALDSQRKSPKMPLHFVTTHSIGLSLLPKFISRFNQLYPDINVHFLFGGITQIKGWLKQGIAEFALVLQAPNVAEYQSIPLYKGKFGLYRHKKERKPVEAIGAYVEHKEGMLVPEFQNAYKLLHGKEISLSGELNSWEFIARNMESSFGYGLIPDLITLNRYPYLVQITEPVLPYTLCAAFPKGEQLSHSAKIFLEELKKFTAI
jgi:DNA-binding transcriptional LysR family regulator